MNAGSHQLDMAIDEVISDFQFAAQRYFSEEFETTYWFDPSGLVFCLFSLGSYKLLADT